MARGWQDRLRPIGKGDTAKRVLTLDRISALQEGLLDLDDRMQEAGQVLSGPLRKGRARDRVGRRPRYRVWFSPNTQRLYVTEGMVATGYVAGRIEPFVPTIDDTPLNDSETPFFDCSGYSADEDYELLCFFTPYEARLELVAADEEIEPEECEEVFLLATVVFGSSGDGLYLKSLEQKWSSDITWCCMPESCESSDSGGDSDDSDSDSDGDPPDSDSDSDSDSGDDSGTPGPCCPEIEVDAIITDPDCLTPGPGLQRVTVQVGGYAGEIPCDECERRLWVEYGIAGQTKYHYLGTRGGDNFSGTFEVMTVPCAELTIFARVVELGIAVDGEECEVGHCEVTDTVQMPPVCGQDCDSDSGSDSDDSGDPPVDSESDSDSDSDDTKNAIVQVGDRFLQMNCVEATDVPFEDRSRVKLTGRVTRGRMDPDFVAMCVPGSIDVAAVVPDRPVRIGARVEGDEWIIEQGFLGRAKGAYLELKGRRRGHDFRLKEVSETAAIANRAFWRQAKQNRP